MVDDPNKPNENDSFMDEDDFLAADREFGDSDQPSKGASLKEVWNQNPSLKIFAIVAFLAVFLIAYMVFGADDDEKEQGNQNSIVGQTGDVSQPPGTAELPPAYEEAVRQASEQRAAEAEENGGSAVPTLIQRPSERIEAPVQVEETDPLSAWRREAEMRRLERQQQPDTETAAPAETVNAPTPGAPAGEAASGTFPANPGTPGATAPLPLPTGPSAEEVAAIAAQLQTQMQTVLETQVPKESVVVSMNIQPTYDVKKYFPENTATDAAGNGNTNGGTVGSTDATGAPFKKPLIQAGTIAYAQILTEANSDVPGPVLAEIASGPLTGGRALGTFQVAQRHLVLRFNRIMKDGQEYPIQGFALDPGTTLPGVVTDVDHHLFSRVVLPAAAAFIEGFAEAATRTDSDVVVSNGTVVTSTNNDLDTKQELLEGVNEGASKVSDILDSYSNRPITIKVAAGTRIGLLFLDSVAEKGATAAQNNYPSQSQSAGLGQTSYGLQQGTGQNTSGFGNADPAVYGGAIAPAQTTYDAPSRNFNPRGNLE